MAKYEDHADALADFEALYRKTENPLYTWWAIHLTVNTDIEVPKWCQEYLAECAASIVALALDDECPTIKKIKEVPRAIRLARKGWSAFRGFGDDAQAAWTAQQTKAEKAVFGKVVATIRETPKRSTIMDRKARLPALKYLQAISRKKKP